MRPFYIPRQRCARVFGEVERQGSSGVLFPFPARRLGRLAEVVGQYSIICVTGGGEVRCPRDMTCTRTAGSRGSRTVDSSSEVP